MDSEEVRRRLKEVKAERGWTAPWIAAQTGERYNDTQVQRMLSGEVKQLPPDFLALFARLAGVRLEWLLAGEEPRTPVSPGVSGLVFQLQERLVDLSRDPKTPSSHLEALLEELLRFLPAPSRGSARWTRPPRGGD